MTRMLVVLAALMLAACNPTSQSPTSDSGAKSPAPAASQAPDDGKAGATPATADDNTVILETKDGQIVIQLRPDLAPHHVAQLKTLIKRKFYDGVVFHRVIGGFMAQTGDPTGTGTGGSDLPDIKAEFGPEPFERGVVGMARSSDPDSANSQFFIMFDAAPSLNGKYTVVGKVIKGMDVVDKIKKGDAAANGMVENPDRIVKMRLQSDAG